MKRYTSIDCNGNILKTGNTITTIEGMGIRYLIDWKKMRYAIQNTYPAYRYVWSNNMGMLSYFIRENRKISV